MRDGVGAGPLSPVAESSFRAAAPETPIPERDDNDGWRALTKLLMSLHQQRIERMRSPEFSDHPGDTLASIRYRIELLEFHLEAKYPGIVTHVRVFFGDPQDTQNQGAPAAAADNHALMASSPGSSREDIVRSMLRGYANLLWIMLMAGLPPPPGMPLPPPQAPPP